MLEFKENLTLGKRILRGKKTEPTQAQLKENLTLGKNTEGGKKT